MRRLFTRQPTTTRFPPSPPMTDAAVRHMFGYTADDPNVEVIFMPLDGERVTAPGNFLDPTSAAELEKALDAVEAEIARDIKAQEAGMKNPAPMAETATEKNLRLSPALDAIMDAVRNEVLHAIAKHAPMHSPHEGHSVILEELDELWDEVKADRGRQASARKEAIQVACTAIRYVLDLDPH